MHENSNILRLNKSYNILTPDEYGFMMQEDVLTNVIEPLLKSLQM